MSFDAAFAIVVGEEGGYINDPRDPGGETKYGISKRAYPNVDIPQLTLDEAKAIYKRDYWDRLNCDALAWEWALCLFDAAVNQGPSAAAAMKVSCPTPIDFLAERARRYAANPTFTTYGLGWMRRLFTICRAGQRTP